MAKGGKRPGAGRPKGSVMRPQLRDYFTKKDRREVVDMLKTHMVDDMNLLKFVAEQLFGKAPQPISGDPDNRTPIPIMNIPSDVLPDRRRDSSCDACLVFSQRRYGASRCQELGWHRTKCFKPPGSPLSIAAWIAIYGAIIATGTLFWTIHRDRLRESARVVVYPQICTCPQDDGEPVHDVLMIDVTNVGSKSIILLSIDFQLGFSKLGYFKLQDHLPKKIESGERHSFFIQRYAELQKMNVQFMHAYDTVGRRYYVEKHVLKNLNAHLKLLADKGIHHSWVDEKSTTTPTTD